MQHIFYSAELTKVRATRFSNSRTRRRLLRNEIKTFLGNFLLTTDRGTIYHRVTRMRSGASHFLAVCRSGIEAVPRFKARERGKEGRKEVTTRLLQLSARSRKKRAAHVDGLEINVSRRRRKKGKRRRRRWRRTAIDGGLEKREKEGQWTTERN